MNKTINVISTINILKRWHILTTKIYLDCLKHIYLVTNSYNQSTSLQLILNVGVQEVAENST